MAFPTFTLEVAFTTDPLAVTPTWVDVTAYFKEVSTRRGRQRDLDTFDAGTASFLLDNQDRRFDPTYTAGPYYGYLIPMRKIRLSITVGATTYRLFTGYVTGWAPVWDSAFTADTRVDCVDGFDIAASAVLAATTRTAELSGARVEWVLDQIGWPAADRDLDSGQSTIVELIVVAGSEPQALSHLLDVDDSELGAVFVKGDGTFAFFDRHRVLKSPYTTVQTTFGDTSDSDVPYEQLQPSYDRDLIKNDVKVTPDGGSTQTASDATSQASYGIRSHVRSPLISSAAEALSAAQYLVSKYKDPALSFDSLVLAPMESDTYWAIVGAREVWDRVTVKRTPPGGGTVISQDCLIEGIEHRGTPDGLYWETTYRLSPASTFAYWVLGDAANSLLGQTTRLAF